MNSKVVYDHVPASDPLDRFRIRSSHSKVIYVCIIVIVRGK